MLTIVIAAVVALLCVFAGCWFKWGENITASIGAMIMVMGIVMAFQPIHGYEEKNLVQEIELVTLSNDIVSEGEGNVLYVAVTMNNVYMYRYEVENTSGLSGKAYEVGVITDNVTEIESEECTKPILRVYEAKAKKSLFCFSNVKEEYYEFYVPVNTITKGVQIN